MPDFAAMTTEEILTVVGIWVFFCGLVALLARALGKSPITGFVLSLILSPLIGFLWAVLSGAPKRPADVLVCTNCGVPLYQQWWSSKKQLYECRHCKTDTPGTHVGGSTPPVVAGANPPILPEPSAQITGRPQQVAPGPTTTPDAFCPRCGKPRTGTLPHCANCGYAFDAD